MKGQIIYIVHLQYYEQLELHQSKLRKHLTDCDLTDSVVFPHVVLQHCHGVKSFLTDSTGMVEGLPEMFVFNVGHHSAHRSLSPIPLFLHNFPTD